MGHHAAQAKGLGDRRELGLYERTSGFEPPRVVGLRGGGLKREGVARSAGGTV
jgi:hypothetical protein